MLKEVLERDLHTQYLKILIKDRWPMPDLVLIDGGLAQVNTGSPGSIEGAIEDPYSWHCEGPQA